MKRKRTKSKRVTAAFRALGRIDRSHEKGKITKKEHDKRSRKVLNKYIR